MVPLGCGALLLLIRKSSSQEKRTRCSGPADLRLQRNRWGKTPQLPAVMATSIVKRNLSTLMNISLRSR